MAAISRLVEAELESVLRLWTKGGCYFQDFIEECIKHSVDIKHLGVEQIGPTKSMTYVICVPKGQRMPVSRLTAIKG